MTHAPTLDMTALATRAASVAGAADLISEVGTHPIQSDDQEAMAAALISSMASHVREWEADIEAPLAQAKAVTKWISGVYPIAACKQAIVRLRAGIGEYRRAKEQALQDALSAAVNKQEVVQLMAVVHPPPPGLGIRDRWSAEVAVPLEATFAALRALDDARVNSILDASVPPSYLMVDIAALSALARAQKETMAVPGVRAVCEQVVVRK